MPAITLRISRSAPRPEAPRTDPAWPILWLRRIRTRRALAALHADQIRDAGLDPYRLRAEILKPCWRA